MNMNYVLETERLLLRPLEEQDLESMFGVIKNNPNLPYYMTWEPHKDLSETIEHYKITKKRQDEGELVRWGIFLENQFIGIISLEGIERFCRKWKTGKAELGYWLDPEFHKQGIMTEAGTVVLGFGFSQLDLHKITVGCVLENEASKKVIEKLGFRLVGTEKDHHFYDGRWWDHPRYEMIINDWKKL